MPATRSINWNTAAACNAGNARSSSSAVTSCDHTKNGMRASVTPGARARTMVVIIDTDDSVAEALTKTIPISHQVWPEVARIDSGGYAVHPELAAPPSTKKLAIITTPPSGVEPVGERAGARQRHVAGANHPRHQQRAEGARRQRHHGQEDHHRAVHRHQLVVELGQHDAAGRVGGAQHRASATPAAAGRATPAATASAASAGSPPAGRTGT